MVAKNQLVEIRWHGRGGQGAVTSAELVAQAAISEDKFAQAFPSFGPERRGAPVLAFVRIDSQEPIRIRAEITHPDVVVVLDPGLLAIVNVAAGLKKDGLVIINTSKSFDEIGAKIQADCRLAKVDATHIAREVLGVPITNTTMVGALLKATGVVKLDSVVKPLHDRFGRIAEKNVNAMKRAYQETELKE
ncbi:MAG: pyruvate ferredoxin oxidoreductase subunit gamma [Dehalococcoidia bacterium]